jgi:hypothetical protein
MIFSIVPLLFLAYGVVEVESLSVIIEFDEIAKVQEIYNLIIINNIINDSVNDSISQYSNLSNQNTTYSDWINFLSGTSFGYKFIGDKKNVRIIPSQPILESRIQARAVLTVSYEMPDLFIKKYHEGRLVKYELNTSKIALNKVNNLIYLEKDTIFGLKASNKYSLSILPQPLKEGDLYYWKNTVISPSIEITKSISIEDEVIQFANDILKTHVSIPILVYIFIFLVFIKLSQEVIE